MESLAQRLRAFRKAKRLSQTEFGNRSGIGQTLISTIEKGKSTPLTSNVNKIIEAFPDLNPEWLRAGDGKMLLTDNKDRGSLDKTVKGEIIEEVKAAYEKVIDGLKDALSKAEERERWYQEQLSKQLAA